MQKVFSESPELRDIPLPSRPITDLSNDTATPPRISYKPANGKSIITCVVQWWRRRTLMEKILFLLLVFFALTFFLHLIFARSSANDLRDDASAERVGAKKYNHLKKPSDNLSTTCFTKGCILAAYNLLMAMNTSVDPCENFYEYACGQWNHDHPIPDDMFAYGTFASLRETVRQQIRILLESNSASQSRSITMARIAYKTCMNTSELENIKSKQLLEALHSMGNWPLLNSSDWDENNFDFTDFISAARRNFGNEIFFTIFVYADAKNTTKNVLYIDQATLNLGRGSRDYYLNATMFSKHLDAYKVYLNRTFALLLHDANVSQRIELLNSDLNNIIELERSLAMIVVPEDNRRNSTRMYNKMKISDLAELLPQVDWMRFFHNVMPEQLYSIVTDETEIIISEVEYLEKLSKLLNATDIRTKTNYILWRIVHGWVKILDARYEDTKQDLYRVMTGQQTKSPRWKECALTPTTIIPLAIGALYIREHFDSTDKKEALEMIYNLREAFKELVGENDWMDDETKKVAIQKAEGMINTIGYPDFINNDTALDEQYDRLHLKESDSYFDLLRKSVIWYQEKEFLRLTKKFDRFEFEVSPAVVNAFYSPEKNALTFPAGILKPPFFSGTYPKMVNYGAMGAVIGHEITHGFDDQGSQFDKDGNLHNWWNDDSFNGFAKRKECIIDQYSSYKVPNTDLKVNGKLTQGENIADNGGVKEAFRAYRRYITKYGSEEPRLPGFDDLTNDQIFFLSYAHFWCGHKKDAAAIQQVLTDEHSPEVFRVIGVLSNLEEFSKAYNCPSDAALNPRIKCGIW